MPTFNYSALDAKGKVRKGVLEAETGRSLRQKLRERHLIPVEVSPVAVGKSVFRFRTKVRKNDLMLITRQLATLVASGMPLEESLRLMAEQAENLAIKRLVSSVRSLVLEGHSLAYAFEHAVHAFPESFVATIAAGEETGHLPEVFERLADEIEVQGKARQSLLTAMIYPLMMLVVCLAIIVLLIVYIVPQITGVFVNLKQELPVLTRGLIALSDWLRDYGLILAILLSGAIVSFLLALRRPDFRKSWDRFLLRLPHIGYWIIIANVSGWSRGLGTLLASGVPVMESLKIAAQRVQNRSLRSELDSVSERVREGDSLQSALAKATHFPPFLIHMVGSGESSGALDSLLLKVSDYYDQRVTNITTTVTKLFEPLLVIFMGGVVLLIVLAILVPIIEMNRLF